jgi:hypothetical protein
MGTLCLLNRYFGHSRSLAPSAVALGILCLLVPAFAQGQDSPASLPDAPTAKASIGTAHSVDHSLTFRERVHVYERSVFNPETIIGPAFTAGINQWRNQPAGFGQGAEGYADRYGSAIGRNVIAKTIGFGFAAIDGEDPRYFRSESRSIWRRTGHAFVSTFVSPTASGHQIPAFSHFAGSYGAAFISNAWYPDKEATAISAARRGSISMGTSFGLNLLREFVPHFNSIVPK